jgi:hypothetical protein
MSTAMVSAAARRRGVIACEIRRASARAPAGPERAKYAAAAMMATISGRAASVEEIGSGPIDKTRPSNSQTAMVQMLARTAMAAMARRTRRHYGVG